MKTKASITLSDDVLAAVDALAGQHGSRSAVIERVLRDFLRRRARARARADERDRLDRHADRLNAHAADVLDYQAPWSDDA